MSKPTHFDVLIVYNGTIATSASLKSKDVTKPFAMESSSSSYNDVYSYFLSTCKQAGLKTAFTTSSDIMGSGICKSYWSFSSNKWHKNNKACTANLIFDKFAPKTASIKASRKLLFSSDKVHPFNDTSLFSLFFDKQKTHDILFNDTIPTITLIDNSLSEIENACKKLRKLVDDHTKSSDFSHDIVMKDRFGAGGLNVYKFNANEPKKMLSTMDLNKDISYIIQPFTKFDKGFTYENETVSTDIRLIYLGGKIVQSYVRMAKSDEFRCNEHQGGSLIYLDLDKIPKKIISKSNDIAKKLNKKTSLYSLDFIISNNGNPYLIEGNTGPGLDWNINIKKNVTKAKELIQMVVKELQVRIQSTQLNYSQTNNS